MGASTQGSFILERDYGLSITINTGKWFDHGGSFARGYKCWYKITYQLDATPPDAPSVESINIKGVSGNVKVGNRIYTNNDPVVLSWNVSKDYGTEYKGFLSGPSGVKDYLVYQNGKLMNSAGVTKPEYQLYLPEGEYKIQIQARDHENNDSELSLPLTLIVDRTVKPVKTKPIEFSETDGKKDVIARWDETTDTSGIYEYQVELLRRINSEWETVSQGITSGVSYRFTDVSSSTLYQIRVRAVDNLGNISEWSYTDEFSPPPSIADITEVNPIAGLDNGEPFYKVQLKLEDVSSNGAASYIIERQNGQGSSEWSELSRINYVDLKNSSFIFVDTHTITKHGKYNYRVYTENIRGEGSNYNNYPGTVVIPNIAVDFDDIVITGPQDNLFVNQRSHKFDINPKKDKEADDLKFLVWFQKADGSLQYSSGSGNDYHIL